MAGVANGILDNSISSGDERTKRPVDSSKPPRRKTEGDAAAPEQFHSEPTLRIEGTGMCLGSIPRPITSRYSPTRAACNRTPSLVRRETDYSSRIFLVGFALSFPFLFFCTAPVGKWCWFLTLPAGG
ncbi:hypothetical protein CSHISOI_00317 [Colletotrichum shisoi]|uniref:Uncharacterized protein n=1 Tax=Colletotrichum shisoi TaxID=2078593 RepID=A0A5Q4C9Q7_9PEZI|nr:hypothetical protein CSHISOI_00317 [Colletotrichum shisoi]